MFKVPENFRVKKGEMRTTAKDGNNGVFVIRSIKMHSPLRCIATDGAGWEHVSVVTFFNKRCPTWSEMCIVKNLFWDAEDAVIQIHPPASEYVNNHPACLHLWRKAGTNDFFEMPPKYLVGIDRRVITPANEREILGKARRIKSEIDI